MRTNLKHLAVVVGVCCAATAAWGTTWTNELGGQFGDAANWDGSPPGPSDDAVFLISGVGTYEYEVDFDSPATNPLTSALYVYSGDDVTFNLAGYTYTCQGWLSPLGPAGTRLTLNGGTLHAKDNVYIGSTADKYGTLVITNGATFIATNTWINWVGRADAYGTLIVDGNSSTCMVNALSVAPSGYGRSMVSIDNGGTLVSVNGASPTPYVRAVDTATATVIVDNASSWISEAQNIYIGYVGNADTDVWGTVIIRGTDSYLEGDDINVKSRGELHVEAGSSIGLANQPPGGDIYVNDSQDTYGINFGVLGGGGEIRLRDGAAATDYYYVRNYGHLQPGDSGVGTLTLEDCSYLYLRETSVHEYELGGKGVGEYDRVLMTNNITSAADGEVVQCYEGNVMEVTVLGSFAGPKVGDTFDLIQARELQRPNGFELDETKDEMPDLIFTDPEFGGELTVTDAGGNKVMRLTLCPWPIAAKRVSRSPRSASGATG